jgi:hypothetical protein
MAVTKDEYELPVCVEENFVVFCTKLEIKQSTTRSCLSRSRHGKKGNNVAGYKVLVVEIEDD